MSRSEARSRFLAASGWAGAEVLSLAGDASARRYFRARLPSQSAVLMDVGDDPNGSLPRFLEVSEHLSRLGLHPPATLSLDGETGLLLLEDLGDRLFAREMEHHPGGELALYRAAIDVLGVIQDAAAPDLPIFDAAEMAKIAGLAARAYAGRPEDDQSLTQALLPPLERIAIDRPVMVMRDFHAENLVWCPQDAGARRVGLLDFQDAVLGHPIYDIVSLVQDARRDVSPTVAAEVKAYAKSLAQWRRLDFDLSFAILGAQRALRILGVFARLALENSKPRYVDLIPRVWGHLDRSLSHPDLSELSETVRKILPKPDASHLNDLKARCRTLLMP